MSSQPTVWAFYDLSLPGRAAWLACDQGELRALGAMVFVAGQPSSQADVFLDGVEIEQQWLKQERWRATLQALRTELASAVDGEVFLRAARRSVWLAARTQEMPAPSLIFGAGMAEALVAWLTSKLTGIPFAASLQDDSRWTSKLKSTIKAEARTLREASLTQCLHG